MRWRMKSPCPMSRYCLSACREMRELNPRYNYNNRQTGRLHLEMFHEAVFGVEHVEEVLACLLVGCVYHSM